MACNLEKLPEELHLQILGYLHGSHQKMARLTCRRWSILSAHGLFRRLYFTPLREAMEIFTQIVSNPLFVSEIEEIVYDIRLFWPHLLDENIYRLAYRDHHHGHPALCEPILHDDIVCGQGQRDACQIRQQRHELFMKSRDRYHDLYHEQQAIFVHRMDYEVLCNGLARIPNVTRFSISEIFDPPRGTSFYIIVALLGMI